MSVLLWVPAIKRGRGGCEGEASAAADMAVTDDYTRGALERYRQEIRARVKQPPGLYYRWEI